MKKFLLTLMGSLLIAAGIFAQDTNKVTTKTFSAESKLINTLSTDGKIYIVITVISILLIGIFLYLFRIEKKLESYEKQK
jgi:uncharacterized membrane protein